MTIYRKKTAYFAVRLIVRVNPPPLRSALSVNPLDYDYMCSEMDFTQGKSYFHPTTSLAAWL